MKKVSKISATLLILTIAVSLFASGKEESNSSITWLTDFQEALKQSKENKKLILIAFTGSDWCHACMRLKKEQFENDSFKKFANENFILLQVDFPRSKKNKPSEEQVAHNEKLAEKYNPDGIFPFLVIINGDERVIGETEYHDPKTEAFIKHLKSLMQEK